MKIPFLSRFGGGGGFSILLITPRFVARADFESGASVPSAIWQTGDHLGESLADQVDVALHLNAKLPGAVYVMSDAFWVHSLSVPATKVRGLVGEELTAALRFEAESLSGIPALDSELACVPAGQGSGEKQYLVTQISKADVQHVTGALYHRDIRLLGLLHPGGLGRSVGGGGTGGWHRVELWSQAVVCACAPASGGAASIQVLASPPESAVWEGESVQWFESQKAGGHAEALVSSPGVAGPAGFTPQSLQDPAILKSFLGHWAQELGQEKADTVPVLRLPEPPLPMSQRIALAAALVAGVGVVCGGHAMWLSRRNADLSKELVKVQEPVKRIGELRRQNEAMFTALTNRRSQVLEARGLKGDFERILTVERTRHSVLLGALAEATPADLAIRSIDERAGAVQVVGLALRPDIDGFATGLDTVLQSIGWRVEAPRRRALKLRPDGGPWQLEWNLTPVETGTNAPSPAEVTKG